MADRFSITLPSEQAEGFLSSLADLFLAFSDSGSDDSFFNAPTFRSGVEKKSPNPISSSSPDLIYPHDCKEEEST